MEKELCCEKRSKHEGIVRAVEELERTVDGLEALLRKIQGHGSLVDEPPKPKGPCDVDNISLVMVLDETHQTIASISDRIDSIRSEIDCLLF